MGSDHVWLLACLALATTAACTHREAPTQIWHSPSGKSYHVLASGPVQGKGWTGVFVKYDAPSEDPQALREAADDLMNALIKAANDRHADQIIVTADYAPKGRKGLINTSHGYNDVYERGHDGAWNHVYPK